MKTRKKICFLGYLVQGKFDQVLFENDLERLRLFYQNAGFLDVEINPDLVSYDFSNPENSKITITIDEGEQYFLGDVEIEGASIYTEQELFKLLNLDKNKELFIHHKLWTGWGRIRRFL